MHVQFLYWIASDVTLVHASTYNILSFITHTSILFWSQPWMHNVLPRGPLDDCARRRAVLVWWTGKEIPGLCEQCLPWWLWLPCCTTLPCGRVLHAPVYLSHWIPTLSVSVFGLILTLLVQAPCLVLFHLYFWCHSFAVWITLAKCRHSPFFMHLSKSAALSFQHSNTSCVCVLTQLSSIHVHLSPSHFVPHTLAIGHSLPSLHTYHHCPISAIFTHTYVSLPFLLMQWGTVTHGWLKQEWNRCRYWTLTTAIFTATLAIMHSIWEWRCLETYPCSTFSILGMHSPLQNCRLWGLGVNIH